MPAVLSKVSSDLRLFAELLIAGILPDQESFMLLVNCIKNMVFLDKDGIQFLVPLASLFKGLTDDLLGIIPRDVREGLDNNGKLFARLIRSDAIKDDKKRELYGVLKDYFDTVKGNIVRVSCS